MTTKRDKDPPPEPTPAKVSRLAEAMLIDPTLWVLQNWARQHLIVTLSQDRQYFQEKWRTYFMRGM